jgi:hypothetical protein
MVEDQARPFSFFELALGSHEPALDCRVIQLGSGHLHAAAPAPEFIAGTVPIRIPIGALA